LATAAFSSCFFFSRKAVTRPVVSAASLSRWRCSTRAGPTVVSHASVRPSPAVQLTAVPSRRWLLPFRFGPPGPMSTSLTRALYPHLEHMAAMRALIALWPWSLDRHPATEARVVPVDTLSERSQGYERSGARRSRPRRGSGWIVPPCAGGFFPFVFSAAGCPVNGLSAVGLSASYGTRGGDDVV
jgi:hypothetical protein